MFNLLDSLVLQLGITVIQVALLFYTLYSKVKVKGTIQYMYLASFSVFQVGTKQDY